MSAAGAPRRAGGGPPVVDLPRVRRLLAELDAHLAARPKMAERTAAYLAGELAAVEEGTLPRTYPMAVRLEGATVARLDRFVEHLRAEQPGVRLARTDAIRLLVHRGLAAFEKGEALGAPAAPYAPNPPRPPSVKDPAAWAASRAALGELVEQGLSQREIMRALNEAGHRTRRGSPWRQGTVSNELHRLVAEGEG